MYKTLVPESHVWTGWGSWNQHHTYKIKTENSNYFHKIELQKNISILQENVNNIINQINHEKLANLEVSYNLTYICQW